MYLIGKDGRILDVTKAYADVEEQLEELIQTSLSNCTAFTNSKA